MNAPNAVAPADFRGSSRRLLRLLTPQRWLIAALLGLGSAGVSLAVLGPRLLGHATNLILSGAVGSMLGHDFPAGTTKQQAVTVLRQHGHGTVASMIAAMNVVPGHGIDFTAVGQVLGWVLALYVFSALFLYLQGRLVTLVVQRAVFSLRAEVAAKLSRLPLHYFDAQPRGEILSRVTNDIGNIEQTLQQTLSQSITALLSVAGVLTMMILISPLLAAVALVTVPLSMLAAKRMGKRAQPLFAAQWATTGRLNAHIKDMFSGHSVLALFRRQQEAAAAFAEHNERLCEASFRAQFLTGLIQPLMIFLGNINYVLVAVIGGLRVASGGLSIGDVQAFIQYSRQFSQPVTQLASMANLIQSGIASAERVFALLDEPEQDPDPTASQRPGSPRQTAGRVEFEHVSFRYPGGPPLIEDLSFSVLPGQTVAIVGPTGAGKTTLINLLMRFYEVTGGRITVDGRDISAMPRHELRAMMGMVLQDPWLRHGTLAENIGYGAGSPSLPQIVAAANAAHVDHFARTLPDDYDTVLEEDGGSLSVGEKQLITIARAVLPDPAILILDEATSSVDTRTELLIQRAMSSLRQGRTSFVIAHRLSTVRDADLVLVMEDGQIVEQGGHDELLAAGGAYTRLYAAQFLVPSSSPRQPERLRLG